MADSEALKILRRHNAAAELRAHLAQQLVIRDSEEQLMIEHEQARLRTEVCPAALYHWHNATLIAGDR